MCVECRCAVILCSIMVYGGWGGCRKMMRVSKSVSLL